MTLSLRGAGLTRHTRTGGLAAGYKSGGQLRASSQRSFTTDIKSAGVAPTALPQSQISPVPFSTPDCRPGALEGPDMPCAIGEQALSATTGASQ